MINRSIIIIVVFEEFKDFRGHFGDNFGGNIAGIIDKMRQYIPNTIIRVQIIHQNIVYSIAKCGNGHLLVIRHFFDNRITNRVEYVEGDSIYTGHQRKRRQFFDIKHGICVDFGHYVRDFAYIQWGQLVRDYSHNIGGRRLFHGDNLAAVQNIIGYEADMVRQQYEFDFHQYLRMIILLNIAVKNVQQFGVNRVEVLTKNDALFRWAHRHNIDDLEV